MTTSIEIYFCGHEQCDRGHSFGPAVRPHYLIHFILNGKGVYHVKGSVFHLQAGDAFLIHPGETTFYEADLDAPWEYTWVGFGGKDCVSLLSECALTQDCHIFQPDHSSDDTKSKQNVIAFYLGEMLRVFQACHQNSLELLGYFYLILSQMSASTTKPQTPMEELYLQKALDYIHNNYGYPIRIRNIALQIGIDRSYLYKLMEQKLHLSPQQYLIEYRFSKAQEMLKNSAMTITEIAFSCGFKDTPSFCRMFKKRTGITPGMFRKNPSAFQLSD